MNLSHLAPGARPIVEQAAPVYLKHTRRWFTGLIAHGSALKGDFIPGCSDVDLQLYLEDGAFTPEGQLPLEIGLAIQRELAGIDPSPFGYIQTYALPRRVPADWTPPVPGAYCVLEGCLPVPEATPEQLLAGARKRLSSIQPVRDHIAHGLLESGAGRLQRSVRWLCTDVWPTLRDLLAIRDQDPVPAWNLTKQQAMARLPEDSSLGDTMRRFHSAVLAYYPSQNNIEDALQVIAHGVAFLQDVKLWWATQ